VNVYEKLETTGRERYDSDVIPNCSNNRRCSIERLHSAQTSLSKFNCWNYSIIIFVEWLNLPTRLIIRIHGA